MNRILITGASGILGRALKNELESNTSYTVFGQAFNRTQGSLIKADLTQPEEVAKLIDITTPDCIVHCAAERRPDVSEGDHDATDALNAHATQSLAEICQNKGIYFIYLSTDYVFDGSKPPYEAEDTPNPLNYYGASKLAGEKAAALCENSLTLRVPILYGEVESLEESAVTVIAKQLLSKDPKSVDHWALRYPTSTADVASVIRQILEKRPTTEALCGIFQWSGNESFTKYEMAELFGKLWGVSIDHLSPAPETPAGAPRPQNCQLSTRKLSDLGIGANTPFESAIASSLAPFKP
ncbi:SDR family oxidoreductase [Puniceicoccaceae bacterium K14]|nr:SDR family oxidoreductase [Puniceicoccaceae bacterium K14]